MWLKSTKLFMTKSTIYIVIVFYRLKLARVKNKDVMLKVPNSLK